MSLLRLSTIWLLCSFMLVACDEGDQLPPLKADVGLQAKVRQYDTRFLMEVTGVEGATVRTEIRQDNEVIAVRDYFRGLLPVAGYNGDQYYRLDFDHSELDALFPLEVGKSVSASAVLQMDGMTDALDVVLKATVKAQRKVALGRDIFDVMIVEVDQIYHGARGIRRKTNTYYYAPELAINLKVITRDSRYKSYWYVTDIKRSKDNITPVSPRRPGSVMI